jgi:hypothetical protein
LVIVIITQGMSEPRSHRMVSRASRSMLPLNGMQRCGVAALGDHQVDGFGAGVFDVGAGRVEVGVRRDDLAGPGQRLEEDPLGGAPLVRGDDVRVGEQFLDRVTEDEVGRRAGVGLVAVLDRGPLVAAHRPGPRVGQQVDEDVIGMQLEQVVCRLPHLPSAIVGGGHPQWLHRVDAEGLEHGPERGFSHERDCMPPKSSFVSPDAEFSFARLGSTHEHAPTPGRQIDPHPLAAPQG